MILKQYYLGCLAHCLVSAGRRGQLERDHRRSAARYPAVPARCGETRPPDPHVFLTHFHADFVAGHLELRDRCGATIHLGSHAQAEYAFVPMKDGDTLEFPGLRLKVLETPGHTIESISILVFDLQKDLESRTLCSPVTLCLSETSAVPDLRASLGWTANDLGAHLYDSLHEKLLPLPDETLVYPGPWAGSLCGKQLSSDTVSSLGDQRRLNYALQPMSKEHFIALVTADQPDAPAYFTYDAILNTRERATLDQNLEQVLHPIDLDEVLGMGTPARKSRCARSAEYAKGHWPGASTSDWAGNTPPGRGRCWTAPSRS
jgi:glyoxylase-like metal-dependent hydrolase (beta-lactamase superfamily II)